MAIARRLRLGMVGGGQGAFIGAVHRIAARLDDRYELVAGCLSSDSDRAAASAAEVHIPADRSYRSHAEMAAAEAARDDGIDVAAVVTPNNVHHGPATAFLEAGIHVICDKPLTTSLDDALDLVATVKRTGLVFGLTHNYTGYPMVRHARDMVASGAVGAVRVIHTEYLQGWLGQKLEDTGMKQATWRTDPARSGPAGSVGDIGTHAHNLAAYVTGLTLESVSAQLNTFVSGRRLDDDAAMKLRWSNGAAGSLLCSQVATGMENALRLRVYGEEGGLMWEQESPNHLTWLRRAAEPMLLTRANGELSPAAAHATRIPAGHPEGYLEGFAVLYSDIAEQISARLENREPAPLALSVPTVEDGARGVKFIEAAVASSAADGAWTDATLDV